MMTRILTRSIWILGLVSLFTDFASEMLYPIMPLYLREIGFSMVLIGFLEGVAEAVAGLSKGYFGRLSDAWNRRLPFVQLGYTLSALSKPMMAILITPLWIFLARTLDRLGKGFRTGARDALLSSYTTPQHKGKVFGFHRSLDTFGAVLGPLSALAFLHFYPQQYQTIFILAFLPGMAAVVITFLLKENRNPLPAQPFRYSFISFVKYPWQSSGAYRRLLLGLVLFALFNSSDIFLLLMLKQKGFSDSTMLMVYIFYNLVYALFAYPLGYLADKLGFKNIFIAGLVVFTLVYAGMAYTYQPILLWLLFALYGLYAAATEGVAKAWISNMLPQEELGTAIGTYEAFRSLAAILASTLAGAIWQLISPSTTFMVTAVATTVLILYFRIAIKTSEPLNKT
ncbi:MAG: MFS transporter [Saprospiraceae bacterium]